MADESRCQICGSPAIGMEILGCCSVILCATHADKTLLSLHPGEKKEFGACYYWRYTEPEG